MNDSIRVLHVVPSLNRAAGVARFVRNMEQYHDEKRVHYDFLHHSTRDGIYMHDRRYDEELKASGCEVFTVNYASDDLRRFIREVREVFARVGSTYDIVHCHMPNAAFCVLREAERCGVSNRILHSHLNNSSDQFLHRLRNMPLNAIGKKYTTDRIACSEDAGRFLFGSKPFTVVNNGIPLDHFVFSSDARASLRAEFGIGENDYVVGCVGRFVKQKNYPFAVAVFRQILNVAPDTRLVILGDGADRTDLERSIAEAGVANQVILPGVRTDVDRFYSMFDVFLMPSLYEGLPVSAVEAQAAGLPCMYSDNVPRETDITGTGTFLSLDADIDEWTKTLENAFNRGRLTDNPVLLEQRGYSAKANAELLMQHYERLMESK
ncbi:Putative glycosyltransferase EpsF [Bifidobacterium pseudocatenulatum]|uniref:Glycosyltransferase EpsF n=1 Tax=Bifidobacterium pseudocatenulatum TaxID=28026 RepID=A0ABY6YD40_BIFPS|nr:glycosyltransferase [Bifidobacterium pseudocatenulatum]CAG9065881.1 Putative glycosyltransferase EpsF [Bifidobacterium pseudocatenulatum]CAG9076101.1 Putative glycosyltransferase EpsF [Bifidobacterium pseudocatenulatum]VWQ23845.1 Putative glycosyltransferase EpsF [Bifidobacterium pseudocatenulatum]VWQ23875.1 Putative glycosyltransferase EpsF [Bifidobacterium pseudocatenulatum]VWQ23879.1 Putative glycosyltransferase EpsF [Bifidobacterium pseudocatenulatum]